MRECIFAYTERRNDYPAFLSVNRDEQGVKLTVRSRGHGGTHIAEIEVPEDEWRALHAKLGERFTPLA